MFQAAELGQRVRLRRLALGIKSQTELAELANLSPSYVSRLEAGHGGDKLEELTRVARALGWRLSQMVGESDEALTAEVRRRLTDGSELVVSFERIVRGLPRHPESDQEFVRRSIEAFADRYGLDPDTEG